MRAELAHPGVTPARDFPSIPPDIRPLPCPDGHAPMPMRAIKDKLDPTEWRIVLYFCGEMFNGFPAVSFTKGRVGEELGPKIDRGVRTTEDAVKRLIRRGYLVARDQLHRDGLRTFLYATWALRDELPELGGGPDRDDPACEVPHRPAFVLRQGEGAGSRAGTPIAARGAESCAAEPRQAAQPFSPEKSGDQSAKNRPAAPPSGPPVRQICAILDRLKVPLPESCAKPPDPPDPQPRTCAAGAQTEPPPKPIEAGPVAQSQGPSPGPQAPVDPAPGSAYVYGLNSPSPEEKTSTWAADERPFRDTPAEQIFAYLATCNIKHSPMYSPPLMELAFRGIAWPERFAGKELWKPLPDDPHPLRKRVVIPVTQPAPVDESSLTLEQKVRRLARDGGDAEQIKELTDHFMKTLGENPLNRCSWRFHNRNLREVAGGVMPPEIVFEALEKFRSGGAEKPRCVFSHHVKKWRRGKGLYTREEARADARRRRAETDPALRGEIS
jgi:hypothetical protein